jgi:predicted aspartyl protease
MSLRFPYLQIAKGQPIVTLGGKVHRPRPVIGVAIRGPAGTFPYDGLLDTGSDDVLLPEAVAALIGIDLTNAPQGTASAFGQAVIPVRYAEATLRIADNQERREWRAWVSFAPVIRRYALLGYAGFLQYFTATFHGDSEEVESTVNRQYPGS